MNESEYFLYCCCCLAHQLSTKRFRSRLLSHRQQTNKQSMVRFIDQPTIIIIITVHLTPDTLNFFWIELFCLVRLWSTNKNMSRMLIDFGKIFLILFFFCHLWINEKPNQTKQNSFIIFDCPGF
mgnify:CR=1 FL=1